MAEPTVCSFLTKVLCAHGGRMLLQDLRGHVELSPARLWDVLQRAGPERFLLQDVEVEAGCARACRVVAVSSARLCARYQRGECQACDQLHFCRRHMLGKCPHRDCWSTCTLSHDIHTPINIQVLKKHGLFGLNEAQLRVLLLQNDPCLLPEVCLLYNKGGDPLYGYCNLKDKCNKFHVCRAFVRGECRLQTCKRSHQLIYATSLNLLQDQGLSIPSVVNFQIIATYKHESLHERLERKDDSSAAPEHPQSPDKQGACTASAAEAGPPVPVAAQLCTGPCPGKIEEPGLPKSEPYNLQLSHTVERWLQMQQYTMPKSHNWERFISYVFTMTRCGKHFIVLSVEINRNTVEFCFLLEVVDQHWVPKSDKASPNQKFCHASSATPGDHTHQLLSILGRTELRRGHTSSRNKAWAMGMMPSGSWALKCGKLGPEEVSLGLIDSSSKQLEEAQSGASFA